MRTTIFAFALATLAAGPALAFHCPQDIAEIDQALQTASLTDEQRAQVTALRNEGEALHQAGQHQQSVDTLAQAKQILGIQ